MDKKNQDFSMAELMRLAKSPAGQQLFAMLQAQDHEKLEQAAAQAKSGDYVQASKTLSAMLSSAEVQKLMKELGDQ